MKKKGSAKTLPPSNGAPSTKPARAYIKQAMSLPLQERRALLDSLPVEVRELLKAHLLIQYQWKRYHENNL
jgi:hypothetical protein